MLNIPAILFVGVVILALVLGALEWRSRNRGMALVAFVLAALAAVFLAADLAAIHAHASIRVDLLFTIPAISLAATAFGALAIFRPPFAARAVGAVLAIVGGVSLVSFGLSMIATTKQLKGVDAAFSEGRRLYWQETVLCQGNFEKRFGPLQRHDSPCFGNLAVVSRSEGAYPYTRVVVNDSGRFALLFFYETSVEDTTRAGPQYGVLNAHPDGSLSIESDPRIQQPAVNLRPGSNGVCDARISNDYLKKVDLYTLRRVELGSCPTPLNSPVTFLGAWRSPVSDAPGAQDRRLTQVWFWETQGKGYALIAADPAGLGIDSPFNFARRFTGTRDPEGTWQLRAVDQEDAPKTASVTIAEGHMRLSAPGDLLGAKHEVVLDRIEIITHPKIALAPVRDAALFESYFRNVFFNLDIVVQATAQGRQELDWSSLAREAARNEGI